MDEKTIAALREAVRLSPDNVALRQHLASVLVEADKLNEAKAEYEEAFQRAPDNVTTLVGLGSVLHKMGRNEEAAMRFSEALRRDGQCAEAHVMMARVLLALKQREKAQRHYQQAIDLDPKIADFELEEQLFPDTTERPEVVREGPSRWGEDTSLVEGLGIPIERPALTFAEVGGMEELKEQIRLNIIYPFMHPEIYRAYGKKVGGGILLYGPPGCGKTYIARATAGECQAQFIAVGIEDVLDMWMGQSEKKMHEIFEAARSSVPAVLFFDEIEAFAGQRSDMKHAPWYRSVVNQFLAEMDGAKGDNSNLLIIGATNSPWNVDPAFRRPGRFDKVIFVPPPDLKARVEILKIHSRNKPVENLEYQKVAARMKKFSGADIQATCEGAAEIALQETLRSGRIRKLNTNDFLNALKTIRPTTEEWLATARNYALYANQTGLYNPVAEYLQRGTD